MKSIIKEIDGLMHKDRNYVLKVPFRVLWKIAATGNVPFQHQSIETFVSLQMAQLQCTNVVFVQCTNVAVAPFVHSFSYLNRGILVMYEGLNYN